MVFSNILFTTIGKPLLLVRDALSKQMATHGLGSPRFGRCRMATHIGLRPFWPLLCGISRHIVSKPHTDTLETSINASHSLDMYGYYLFQVVWYVLPRLLCNISDVLGNFGNELRPALVGPA